MARHHQCFRSWVLLITVLLLSVATVGTAHADEKIVVQLRWEHEYQFAGFYAAKWQGFYQDAGLDVELRSRIDENGNVRDIFKELEDGSAQFGVSGVDILSAQSRSHRFQIVAPLFQRSPSAVFSLNTRPLTNPHDLLNMRVAALGRHDYTQQEVMAMLLAEGINPDHVNFVQEPLTIETLLSGKADALVTYRISAITEAREHGVKLNMLVPSEYGVNFYGDTLFTTKTFATTHPDIVGRFLEATLKGWHYALQHKVATATQITDRLPRHGFSYEDLLGYNLAFADIIDELIKYPESPIGHNNPGRWQNIYATLHELGLMATDVHWDELFFAPKEQQQQQKQWVLLSLGIGFASLLLISLLWWWKVRAIAAITLILFSTSTCLYLEHKLKREAEAEQHKATLEELASIRTRIEGIMNQTFSILKGLSSYIALRPELSMEDFELYAQPIVNSDRRIRYLSAAPDMVVEYIYPLTNNQQSLGLTLRKLHEQNTQAMQMKKSEALTVAGPESLIQGGSAFVGRYPVYIKSEFRDTFWGMVSAPIDVNQVYEEAGLFSLSQPLEIAIRGKDGLGSSGEIFHGQPETFSHPQAIQLPVTVGSGQWLIAGYPRVAPHQNSSLIWGMRLAFIFFTGMTLFLFETRWRQQQGKEQFRQQLLRNEQLQAEVGNLANVGGWEVDSNGFVVNANGFVQELLDINLNVDGSSTSNTLVQHVAEQLSSEAAERIDENLTRCLHNGDAFELEVALKAKPQSRWFQIIGRPKKHNEAIIGAYGTVQDITEQKRASETIHFQANYDALTNLPNRFLFRDCFRRALARAGRYEYKVALIFLDLDNFKTVNESEGHSAGDQVLLKATERIKSTIRRSDTIGRLSGDEFAIIISNIHRSYQVYQIADQLLAALAKPYQINGRQMLCTASIGIALYPSDGQDVETLLRNADQAMYQAKRIGKDNWQFFTPELQRLSEHRHRIRTRLAEAIQTRSLQVYYQPVVDKDGLPIGVEALVRWIYDGEVHTPSQFLTIAEDSGLINQIDCYVAEKSLEEIGTLLVSQVSPLRLHLNVSPKMFQGRNPRFNQWLDTVLSGAKKVPITIELNESLLAEDNNVLEEALEQLDEEGIQIAIDDFGSGYSSMSYIQRFPISALKIDSSLIDNMLNSERHKVLVEVILSMAEKLNFDVIAEGVASKEQQALLAELGGTHIQGYMAGEPMPADALRKFLK
jgi:diguanylate cyclase (GGDEF)-like protein